MKLEILNLQKAATCSATCNLLSHSEEQCNTEIGNRKIFHFSHREQQYNIKIGNRKKFCSLHSATCALLLHGSNSATLKLETKRHFIFHISLHVLCYSMMTKIAIPKSKIGYYEIRNSGFHRERPRVPIHVLCCSMGSNNATLKSKIGSNSAFLIPLHVLCCHIGINSATLKSEIGRYFTFYVPLHVLYYRMVIKSATLKSEIGNYKIRNSDFCRERPHVPLHVLCCRMSSNNVWKLEEISLFHISLYVLYCRMTIKSATPKSEIKNRKLEKEIVHEKMCRSKALSHGYNAMNEKMW